MRTLSLALRNLMRNRRRSAMTLLAMTLGLVAVLLFGGYVRDITCALQSDFVRLSGHLQIQHRDYFRYGSGDPSAYGIADYERILKLLRDDAVLAPMLTVATPTLQFGGIAGNFSAAVSRTVFANGAVVEDQNQMRQWNDYGLRMRLHPLALVGTAADNVVVGTGVARVLQLCGPLKVPDCPAPAPPAPAAAPAASLADDIAALAAGQASAVSGEAGALPRIEILATNSRGAPNVAAVRVLRAEFQGIKELDDVSVTMHLAQAQRLIFGAQPPQVTAIVLQLKHTAQIPQAQARLQELLQGPFKGMQLEVIDFETLNPFYGQTLGMFRVLFGFVSVLIGAIVLFTVSNTMSMTVVERTAEIGTLRAIGVRRSGVRATFVVEGLVLGAVGAVLGIAVALVVQAIVNALHITWTPPGRVEDVPLAVRVAGEYTMMLSAGVASMLVAALSAILPAARAARMNIVDALRHV